MSASLRGAAIASVVAAAAATTSVMAQTTGSIPPQPPPSEASPSPPSTTNQFSSNELIDAGHRFFGRISHGLAMSVEKAVSQWGMPNGCVLGEEVSGAFVGGLRYGEGKFIQEMPAICASSGKDRVSASTPALMVRGP
jgi:hypothetical protein